MDYFNKLLTIKLNKDNTNYPFNLINNTNNIIFTKKQINLYYIKQYNICTDNKNKIGKNENKDKIIVYL